jgi:hypothetical protein
MSAFDSSFAPLSPETISQHAISDKAMERHYSVEEIGDLWGLSSRTVRRMFENEPGIIVFGNMGSLKKRRYITDSPSLGSKREA